MNEAPDRRTTPPEPPPRFCPRCRTDAPAAERLCNDCGEALVNQGYCPVCERHIRTAVGETCPKHDVELIDHAPYLDYDAEWGPVSEWTVVGVYVHSQQADIPRIRLEAEGIPTFVSSPRMSSKHMYNVATGGAKLYVPPPMASDARILLAQTWEMPHFEDEDDEDEWYESTPSSIDPNLSSAINWGTILIFLVPPIIAAIEFWLKR